MPVDRARAPGRRAKLRAVDGLRELVASALGADGEIEGLRRLTGGASRETWSFAAGGRRLILRRDPPEAPAGMAHEAAALRAAAAAGVPVPEVLAASDDPGVLGAPFVLMAHVDGETLAPRILRSDELAGVRPRLAEQCGEILARIHAIDVAAVPGLEHRDVVADLGTLLRGFAEVSPALELGMRRLERHRPPDVDPVVVHGDFRNGNLIIGPDGVRAVLDWELVHLGDPMQDLGWLCTRCWRFGGPGDVGGFGTRKDLFRGYERVSGRPVDPALVRWWELYGTVWWGAGCMVQARRHLSGGERALELAAIGRRVHEQAYDTLLLLEGMAA
jgi:aminoglycoside phosphotransferase (APT) family kinase protein